ncbi:MAG: glycosyltransferase family 4 protein [Gemmatimonadaceae bacterium]|nr:glycosyltransferase family 4 protein [Gemmatimonadaceae bacterium]
MRHLFVTQDYGPDLGGMARRHVELCRRIAPPDTLVVSTVASRAAPAFDRAETYEIVRQPFAFADAKRFTNQLVWGRALARRCRAGVDVIHLGNIRPCGYAVGVATRRVPIPYLVYVNGGDLLRERQKSATSLVKRWSGRDIFQRAIGVVANSAWTARLASDVMQQLGVRRPPPVAPIDLGTDTAQFAPSRDTRSLRARLGIGDALMALCVARLVPHKGQDTAVRAIAELGAAAQGMHLVLVGEGDDAPRLAALAESSGLRQRVHLTGALPDADVAEAYATADVYLGLSRVDSAINAEGFGISFVEAAASGTPSVAGDSGGVRSAVRDGETGFVVPPTDVQGVAAALARLIGDPALRAAMGVAGRRAVETHYNWDRVARETLDFTRQCLATPSRP